MMYFNERNYIYFFSINVKILEEISSESVNTLLMFVAQESRIV